MNESLSSIVDEVIIENEATIPHEEIADVRHAVLEVFSVKCNPSTPIEELEKQFGTREKLKFCIGEAVDIVKEQILF
ncbi:MAG: hypothetical protein ABID64_02745 [Nitrospirota bacterium]